MVEKIFGIASAVAAEAAAAATAAEGEAAQGSMVAALATIPASYPDFCCFLVYADPSAA